MPHRKNITITLNLLFALLAFGLILRLVFLRSSYKSKIAPSDFLQQQYGMRYKVINKDMKRGQMIIVDLLGINFLSAQKYHDEYHFDDFDGTQIIVYHLFQAPKIAPLSNERFLEIISSIDGVVLVDNFCIRDWNKVRKKEIYQNTNLSPGPYCFSEPQTLLLDKLIKKYDVSDVLLYYDSSAYLELIQTFLTYLTESNISYRLIKTGTAQ